MQELRLGHFAFTIIHVSRKVIEKLPRDGYIFRIRKTLRREKSERLHDRYVKVQYRMREHILSSGHHSSTKNVNGLGLANMSRDLPSKKSQLDRKLFGVGV